VTVEAAGLEVGNAAVIAAEPQLPSTEPGGPRVALRLRLRDVYDLTPTAVHPLVRASARTPSQAINQGTVIGAADRLSALSADDAAAIQVDDTLSGVPGLQAVAFADQGWTGRVTMFRVDARLRYVSGTGDVTVQLGTLVAEAQRPPTLWWTLQPFAAAGPGGTPGTLSTPGGFVPRTVELTQHGLWRPRDIRAGDPAAAAPGDLRLLCYLEIPSGVVVQVGRLSGRVETERTAPPATFGGLEWYRTTSETAAPVVGVDTPLAPRSVELTHDDHPPAAGFYFYWAWLFDARGRQARLLGPQLAVVH
jgi:hypothetical protein